MIIAGLFMWSCSAEKSSHEKLFSEWHEREIKLPDVMTYVCSGYTVDLSDADFTILSYVDSTDCTNCKQKFPIWNEFANSSDSISDVIVSQLVVVHPIVDKEITYFFI